jgi:hypothetical protein
MAKNHQEKNLLEEPSSQFLNSFDFDSSSSGFSEETKLELGLIILQTGYHRPNWVPTKHC